MAARALVAQGAHKLVFLSSVTATYSARIRGEGFVQTLAPAVQRGELSLRCVDAPAASYAGGFDAAQSLLSDAPTRPEGIFCANDVLACGLVDGARQHLGLRVPEDCQVIGFDDIPMASLSAYALTTLRQDVDALAQSAVNCLAERMAEPDMPGRTLQVPVTLIGRSSSRI